MKIKEIAVGWKNLLLGLNTELAKERAKHCEKCSSADIGFHDGYIGDKIETIKGLICIECGCVLSAKLRSPDSPCPLGKWK